MEPAKIDWATIHSIYVEDDLYEHINAPKWVDFSALDDSVAAAADEAWFCKPDCRHPKTADDFRTPAWKVEHVRSVTDSEIIPLRDANMKRRLVISSSLIQSSNGLGKEKLREVGDENENPNLYTPNHQQRKQVKATVKSSTEKKKRLMMMNEPFTPNCSHQDDQRKVKDVSARNLGKEIVNHISEICSELKKLALVEETPNSHKHIVDDAKGKPLNESKKKDEKPLNKNLKKEGICVELKKFGKRGEENVLQVRTSPPTPQCFSAASSRMPLGTLRTATALNPSTILERRNILQETEPNNREVPTDSDDNNNQRNIAVSSTEAKSLDMFWFLRPCTFLTK